MIKNDPSSMADTQGFPPDSTADMLDLFNVAKAALWMPSIPIPPPPTSQSYWS